jgi:hypothetical protein
MAPKTKTSVQHGAAYARGGQTKMAKPQAAGPQKPGGTAHAVKGGAPGAKAARGGGHAPVPGRSLSAKGGRTGVR